jgi:4-carboxymuconolactone decarboxylase
MIQPMRILPLLALTAATLFAQALPADIDRESFSRLPLIKRDQLSGEALKTYDAVLGKDAQGNPKPVPSLGPAATSLYSMGVALPMDQLNKYIRTIKVGPAMYQLCSIIAAREFDEPYEWMSHAAAAVRAGISEKAVEAIKYDRALDGVPEKEALVIHFGRAILRDHKVNSDLYAKVVKEFGREGMFELTSTIADYAMAAMMLRAVDQHWPSGPVDLPSVNHSAR